MQYITELESLCKVTLLWGNHDILMFDSVKLFKGPEVCFDISKSEKREIWFYNGGKQTYFRFVRLSGKDKKFVEGFFGKLQADINLTVNNREYTLCHSLPFDAGGSLWNAVWARLSWTGSGEIYCDSDINAALLSEKYGNKTIVHGHTPVFHYIDSVNSVGAFKYTIGDTAFIDIDLAAGSIGKFDRANLCALKLDDMREFYAL